MPVLAMPTSLKFALVPAHKLALDRIGPSEDVPRDFTISETRALHAAWLTDLKVKTDYWHFLHDLWRATWGTTEAREMPLSDRAYDGDEADVENVYGWQALGIVIELAPDLALWTAVSWPLGSSTIELRLTPYRRRDRVLATKLLKTELAPGWALVEDDSDGWDPYLSKTVSAGSDPHSIDPAEAAAQVKTILAAITASLPELASDRA